MIESLWTISRLLLAVMYTNSKQLVHKHLLNETWQNGK